MSNTIKIKRGTDLSNINPAPAAGELIYKTDTRQLYVGDGSTAASSLTGINTNTNTTYSGGTNLTLSGTTFNVDDAFLKNNANDSTSGIITATGFITSSGGDLELGDSAGGNSSFLYNDSQTMISYVNGAERFRVNSSGNIGIGTATPDEKLSVVSGSSSRTAHFGRYEDNGLFLHSEAAANDTHKNWIIQTQENIDGGLEITPSASNGGYDWVSAGGLAIKSNGHVGIGTNAPAEKLHIVSASGDARILLDAPNGSDTEIKFFNAGNAVWTLGHDDGSGAFRLGTTNVDSGVAINVATGGSVGIGNSSPASWLDVSKDNSNSGNQFVVADTEGASAAVRTYTTSSPAGLILNHYYAVGGNPYMRYADLVANVGSGAATTMRFITKNSSNAYFTTTINDAGTLHAPGSVKSDTSLLIGSTSNFATTQLKVGDGTRDIRLNANHSSKAVVGTVGSHDFNFITANTIRATVDSGGNFGIGTEAPGNKLEVRGDIAVAISDTQDIIKLSDAANDGSIELYTGESTPVLRTKISSAATSYFNAGSVKVGIGTTSPSYTLDVHGDMRINGTSEQVLRFNSHNSNIQSLEMDASRFYFYNRTVGAFNSIAVLNSGAVGIGTISPSKKFVVKGASGDQARFEHNGAVGAVDIYSGTDGGLLNVRNSSGTSILELDGRSTAGTSKLGSITATQIELGDGNELKLGGNDGIRMQGGNSNGFIDNYTGNLYFRQKNDQGWIHFMADNSSGTSENYYDIDGTNQQNKFSKKVLIQSTGDVDLSMEGTASNTTAFKIRNGSGNNRVDFMTAGANAMTINSSRNVGIGATNPVEKLCVRSTATYATSIEYDASTRLRIGVAGSGVATFTTDNNAACAFTKDVVAYATSDKRLKDNIKPLDNALDKISKISGVEFDWNDTRDEDGKPLHSYKGHDVGVIAQEIEEVLPEVVTTRDNGYKAVKYEKIVPLLIEAIKEQQEQIDELRKGKFVIQTGD